MTDYLLRSFTLSTVVPGKTLTSYLGNIIVQLVSSRLPQVSCTSVERVRRFRTNTDLKSVYRSLWNFDETESVHHEPVLRNESSDVGDMWLRKKSEELTVRRVSTDVVNPTFRTGRKCHNGYFLLFCSRNRGHKRRALCPSDLTIVKRKMDAWGPSPFGSMKMVLRFFDLDL